MMSIISCMVLKVVFSSRSSCLFFLCNVDSSVISVIMHATPGAPSSKVVGICFIVIFWVFFSVVRVRWVSVDLPSNAFCIESMLDWSVKTGSEVYLIDSPMIASLVNLNRLSRLLFTCFMVSFSSKSIMPSVVKLRSDFTGIRFEGKNTFAGPKVIICT